MTSSQTSTRVVLVTGSSVRGLLVTHYYTDRVFINRGELRVLLEREREREREQFFFRGKKVQY